MPIKIVDLPDPFTSASRERSDRAPLIESDAYRQLLHELRRYCGGELAGRSFLIAGHRGSGKTTLVSSVFEALLREQAHEDASREPVVGHIRRKVLRPLPVFLQGPTLLPSSKEDLPLASDGTGETGRRLTEMENVLVQITLGLYRALAREMVVAFRLHVNNVIDSPRVSQSRAELSELAAQFQLELDDYSGKARLRDIWRRGDAMRSGVLYAAVSPNEAFVPQERPLHFFGDTFFNLAHDQGLRELVGLMSVCDAYRRISGKISRKDESKSGESRTSERSAEIDAKGKDLAGPFVAALMGAAVGTGTLVANVDSRVAALAGILTALAGIVVGKVSVSQKRERSSSLEDLFIPDLSVATMDRILPVLLDRLRDAGLAPIFVIDELDKVDGLSDRIQDMIRRLKKMVAENACFCFLADRNYFEEMRQRTALKPYSIEHTYFTHQLFIAFHHTDVREYLGQILARPEDSSDVKDLAVADQIKEEQADHAVLPYILMHGSQMHPIDLLRQIAQLRGANGDVLLGRGAVRSRPRYQLELLVQLAIEHQLEQEAMQEELDRRPPFRRLAHDAMYFISREWEKDGQTLSLNEDARPAFERYLIGRMALDKKPEAPRSAPDQGALAEEKAPLVSSEDLSFLWLAVQTLAQELASPEIILKEYEKRGTSEVVLSALREAVGRGALLEQTHDRPDVYQWRFRRSGRKVSQTTVLADKQWEKQAATIRAFEAALAAFDAVDPSTLSAGLGILPTSPAWPSVSTALSRLGTLSPTKKTYPEIDDDVSVVRAYAELVKQNGRSVARAMFCASVLSSLSQSPDTADIPPVLKALQQMSFLYGLPEMRPDQVGEALEQLTRELAALFPAGSLKEDPAELAAVADWFGWMKEPMKEKSKWPATLSETQRSIRPRREKADPAAWKYWEDRLRGSVPKVSFDVVIAAVAGGGPFKFLKLPLTAMTLRDWSVSFFQAITAKPGDSATPPWLALAALRELGWGARVPLFVDASVHAKLFGKDRAADLSGQPAWIASSQPPGVRAPGAFVAALPDSISETWRPSSRVASLVLRHDEWATLQEAWSELLPTFDYDFVAVDMSGTAPAKGGAKRTMKTEAALPAPEPRAFLNFFSRAARIKDGLVPLILKAPIHDILPPRYRAIVQPKSLEDLIPAARPVQQAM